MPISGGIANYNTKKNDMIAARDSLLQKILSNNISTNSVDGDDGTGRGNFICMVNNTFAASTEFWFMNVETATPVTDGINASPYDVDVYGGCLYLQTRNPVSLGTVINGQYPTNYYGAYNDITVFKVCKMTIKNLLQHGTVSILDDGGLDDISNRVTSSSSQMFTPPSNYPKYDTWRSNALQIICNASWTKACQGMITHTE